MCKWEGKSKKESGYVCVCVHVGEIHYSDNESIRDNTRQFTSPVVVFSIEGEDTFPARSQRTWSSAAASLACLPTAAAATTCRVLFQSTIECVSSGVSLHLPGCGVLFSG